MDTTVQRPKRRTVGLILLLGACLFQTQLVQSQPRFGGPKPPGLGRGHAVGPPLPGQILAPALIQILALTAAQQVKLAVLQKEIDARLSALLTDEQKAQLENLKTQALQNAPGANGSEGGSGPPGGFPGGPPQGGNQ